MEYFLLYYFLKSEKSSVNDKLKGQFVEIVRLNCDRF